MSLYKVEKLIDLACSTTHHEEARTAALSACRLIRKHGLTLSAGPPAARARRPAQRRAEPVREKPPNGGAWERATGRTRCEGCGESISSGDEVYRVADVVWCSRH